MARARGVLLETTGGWTLLTSDGAKVCAPTVDVADDPVAALLESLREDSRGGWKLIVAVSSHSTMAVRLAEDDFTGRRMPTQEILQYSAEEHLPWAAEEVTVQIASRSESPLAIAVLTNRWERLLSGLRTAGHQVCACVPAALLRFEALRNRRGIPPGTSTLFQDDEGTHFIQTDARSVSDWKFWPTAEPEGERTKTRIVAAEVAAGYSAAPIHAVGIAPELIEELDRAGFDVASDEDSPVTDDEWLWRGADSYWKPRSGTFDLAVGRLAGTTSEQALVGAVRSVLVALMILFCTTVGVLWWRTEQVKQVAETARAQQVALFRETFPGAAVPEAITSRFHSRYRRIVGKRGGRREINLPPSALRALEAVLAAHRGPLRCQFEELDIADDLVEIEAKFRSHEDAARMVEQLQQQGLDVDPPQLQKLDERRFGTRLRGRLRIESGQAPAGRQATTNPWTVDRTHPLVIVRQEPR